MSALTVPGLDQDSKNDHFASWSPCSSLFLTELSGCAQAESVTSQDSRQYLLHRLRVPCVWLESGLKLPMGQGTQHPSAILRGESPLNPKFQKIVRLWNSTIMLYTTGCRISLGISRENRSVISLLWQTLWQKNLK